MIPARWITRFSRQTTSGLYIPEIDGLRFVSIVLVVMYHLSAYVSTKDTVAAGGAGRSSIAAFLSHGHHGVQLFFAISGFVLALPFAAHALNRDKPVSLKAYFLRRITRLEPPYILVMLGAAAATVLTDTLTAGEVGPRLAASLTYLHGVLYREFSPILAVSWSLEVEVQFYILAPWLAMLLFGIRSVFWRRSVLLSLIVVGSGVQYAMGDARPYSLSLAAHFHFFLVGFVVADLYLTSWQRRPTRYYRWDFASGISALLIGVTWYASPLILALGFPLLLIVFYMGAFRGRITSVALSLRYVTIIGGMCYTIYLLHYPLISAVGRLTLGIGRSSSYAVYLAVQTALVGSAILGACAAFFVLVERPCMDRLWPQKLYNFVRLRFSPNRSVTASGT